MIGRNDTSSLEAQVRGSRYAWSIRIVGLDALIKLMEVNLATSSEQVTEKIHKILRPFEYTRIDQIVDVVFTTAEDKEAESVEIQESTVQVETEQGGRQGRVQTRTPRETIDAIKAAAIGRLGAREHIVLRKKRHSMYADANDTVHAVVAVSKSYESGTSYWYAYHQTPQRDFLAKCDKGFLILGMTNRDFALALPFDFLEQFWNQLNETRLPDGRIYKHLMTYEIDGEIHLRVNRVGSEIALNAFKI